MNRQTCRKFIGTLGLAAAAAWANPAHADRSVIKRPGQHPSYGIELEPHLVLGFIDVPGKFGGPGKGVGPGVRATFEVVDNGFVSSINNTVGIGIGADVLIDNKATLAIPIVMQWNFWLSENWSVFGEPGLTMSVGEKDGVGMALYGGGRFLLSNSSALTFRVGHPSLSIGYSFLM